MGSDSVTIRPLAAGDIDRVCQIEEAVFSMPWSRASFESELEDDGTTFSWVAERNGDVIAYFVAWLVEDELHIGNIAVESSSRRRGTGERLLTYCLERAVERGVSMATLEVRVSNAAAAALYEKHGFQPVAIRRRYYSDNGEDAIVMLRAFPSHRGGQ
jgi:ribosomal-protein-alanine N-acetyltransferase